MVFIPCCSISGSTYRSLAYNFRVCNNTICLFVPETCRAIYEVLKHKYFHVRTRFNSNQYLCNPVNIGKFPILYLFKEIISCKCCPCSRVQFTAVFIYVISLQCPQTPGEWSTVAEQFWKRWQFPNCIGALDGKHVTLRQPFKSGSYFFNYKHTFSIVLMALVDANYQ